MTTHHYILPIGVALLMIGFLLRYLIGKRRFQRRNAAGLQQFSSYGLAIWVRFWERLVTVFANLLIAAGSVMVTAAEITNIKF